MDEDIGKIAKLQSKDRSKNVKINILISFAIKILGIVLSYLVVSITVDYLNSERYGIWMTLLSILSWVSFCDIGVGNGLRNKLSEALTKNDIISAKEYVTTAYASISAIVSILFLIVLFLVPKLNWNIIFNTKTLDNKEFTTLIFIVVIFFLFNFILSLCNQLFYAVQKSALTGIGTLLLNVFLMMNILILKKIGSGSLISLGFSYGLAMVFSNLILTVYFFLKYKELMPKFKYIRKNKLKDILGTGIKFFIIQIASLVIFTTDNMIITQVLGPKQVTSYNLAQKLFSAVTMVHVIIITPLWSAYTEAYIKKDIQWIKNLLKKMNLLMIPIIVCVVILSVISDSVLSLWIGNNIKFPKYLIAFTALYTVVNVWNNIYAYFLSGIGKINLQMYLAIIAGTINIPLSIIFAKSCNLGNSGVILGTIASLSILAIVCPIQSFRIIRNMEKMLD